MSGFRLSLLKSCDELRWLVLFVAWISFLPNLATHLAFFSSGLNHGWWFGIYFVLAGFLVTCFFNGLLILFVVSIVDGIVLRFGLLFLLIIATVIGFYSWQIGMLFDKIMFANLIQTNVRESLDLVSVKLFFWVCFVAILPGALILRMTNRHDNDHNALQPSAGISLNNLVFFVYRFVLNRVTKSFVWFLLLIVIGGLAGTAVFVRYAQISSAVRNKEISFHSMAPVNFFAAAMSYAYAKSEPIEREVQGGDARVVGQVGKPRLVFFLLGETARAQNYRLNGYERDTNPYMSAMNGVYFPNTLACGTSTAISVPCIYSGIKQNEFTIGEARRRDSLLDVMSRAGVRVLWRDNDDGCKGVCDRVEAKMLSLEHDPNYCLEDGNCFDEILFNGLEEKIDTERTNTAVFLHLKGSHGPAYYKRYPKEFEVFKPTCQSSDLAACQVADIMNSYDNTIRYTDYIVEQARKMLVKLSDHYDVALIYVSDHGESLGEKGLFLHGIPYSLAPDEQKLVPLFFWFSKGFQEQLALNESCFRELPGRRQAKHEDLYSTLLGMLNIQTAVYDENRDLLSVCRPH